MIIFVIVPRIIAAVAVPKGWTYVTTATGPLVMRIKRLAIHVVSLAVNVADLVVALASIPVINATGRLVQIAQQWSGVLMSTTGTRVEGCFVAAVRKTYSLGQTNHVPAATTSTVTNTSTWYLATFAVIHVAMTVESSELWKVVVAAAVRERDMVARASVAVTWLFPSSVSA